MRLLPRNFPSRKLLKRLILAGLLVLTLTSSVLSQNSTPTPPTQAAIVEEIQNLAKRHVENDKPMATELALDIHRQNSVGLTVPEIVKIYEEEYERLREEKNSNFLEIINDNIFDGLGWAAAGILLILLIFKDALQKYLENFLEKIIEFIYGHISGLPLFYRWSLKCYRQGLINKHKKLKIPFRTNQTLELRDVFIPLKVSGKSKSDLIEAEKATIAHPRLMIRGIPGAGKSVLLKYLALSWAEGRLPKDLQDTTPILLELHRLSDPDLTQEKLQQELVNAFDRDDFPNADRFVEQGLENGTLMLLLDGLDEVNSNVRSQVVRQIKDLLDKFDDCRAVITCRTAVYKDEFTEEVEETLDIAEFSDRQILLFLRAWEQKMPPEKSIDQLMQALRKRPKILAFARNPLSLTIITYLYTEPSFILPHSRAEFYQEATDILLKLRDSSDANPNRYKAIQKHRVLQHLALFAQDSAAQRTSDRRSLDYQVVLEQIKNKIPDLNIQAEEAQTVLDEIVEQSGLLLKIDRGDRYQFAHLSLQEFFAAAALSDRDDELTDRFARDPDTWRETVKLWCGLAQNSTRAIAAIYQQDRVTGFECLADAQDIDPALANRIIQEFKQELHKVNQDESLAIAFGAVAAASQERGKAMFDFLEATLLNSSDPDLKKAAVTALSMTNLPKAAEILFESYQQDNFTEAHQSLIRMGDLAVSQLKPLTEQGNTNAMQDLVDIGTPYASDLLKELQKHENGHIARKAALYLIQLTNKN